MHEVGLRDKLIAIYSLITGVSCLSAGQNIKLVRVLSTETKR
jgi:hypothetical protein